MKRIIPLKNYIILFLITFLTVTLLIYFTSIYNKKKDYDKNNNIRMSFLKVMQEEDFVNFITENQEFVLYISNSNDKSIMEFEKDLKKSIVKKSYEKDMIYLNSKNLSKAFMNSLKIYFNDELKKKNITTLPNVSIIKNGKISNILYISSVGDAQEIITFIENNYYGAK